MNDQRTVQETCPVGSIMSAWHEVKESRYVPHTLYAENQELHGPKMREKVPNTDGIPGQYPGSHVSDRLGVSMSANRTDRARKSQVV